MKDSPRRDFWLCYIRDLADAMGLRDWSVMVRDKPGSKRYGASVNCTYGRKIIEIKLCPGWDELAPERQRHYLVHELVHVHFWAINQATTDARNIFDSEAMQLLERQLMTAEEYGVDAIAEILAAFMPLPVLAEPESEVAA